MPRFTLKLKEGSGPIGPAICVNGRGPNTYLWVGDNHGTYSYTVCNSRRLRKFAEAILRRLKD